MPNLLLVCLGFFHKSDVGGVGGANSRNKSRCIVPQIRSECKRWLCNVVVDFLQSNTCVPDLFPNDGHAQVEEDDAVASGAQHFHKVPKIATCQSHFKAKVSSALPVEESR